MGHHTCGSHDFRLRVPRRSRARQRHRVQHNFSTHTLEAQRNADPLQDGGHGNAYPSPSHMGPDRYADSIRRVWANEGPIDRRLQHQAARSNASEGLCRIVRELWGPYVAIELPRTVNSRPHKDACRAHVSCHRWFVLRLYSVVGDTIHRLYLACGGLQYRSSTVVSIVI